MTSARLPVSHATATFGIPSESSVRPTQLNLPSSASPIFGAAQSTVRRSRAKNLRHVFCGTRSVGCVPKAQFVEGDKGKGEKFDKSKKDRTIDLELLKERISLRDPDRLSKLRLDDPFDKRPAARNPPEAGGENVFQSAGLTEPKKAVDANVPANIMVQDDPEEHSVGSSLLKQKETDEPRDVAGESSPGFTDSSQSCVEEEGPGPSAALTGGTKSDGGAKFQMVSTEVEAPEDAKQEGEEAMEQVTASDGGKVVICKGEGMAGDASQMLGFLEDTLEEQESAADLASSAEARVITAGVADPNSCGEPEPGEKVSFSSASPWEGTSQHQGTEAMRLVRAKLPGTQSPSRNGVQNNSADAGKASQVGEHPDPKDFSTKEGLPRDREGDWVEDAKRTLQKRAEAAGEFLRERAEGVPVEEGEDWLFEDEEEEEEEEKRDTGFGVPEWFAQARDAAWKLADRLKGEQQEATDDKAASPLKSVADAANVPPSEIKWDDNTHHAAEAAAELQRQKEKDKPKDEAHQHGLEALKTELEHAYSAEPGRSEAKRGKEKGGENKTRVRDRGERVSGTTDTQDNQLRSHTSKLQQQQQQQQQQEQVHLKQQQQQQQQQEQGHIKQQQGANSKDLRGVQEQEQLEEEIHEAFLAAVEAGEVNRGGTKESKSGAYGVTEAEEEDDQKAVPAQLTSAQAEASVGEDLEHEQSKEEVHEAFPAAVEADEVSKGGTKEGESRAYGVTEAEEEDDQKADPAQLTSAQAEASLGEDLEQKQSKEEVYEAFPAAVEAGEVSKGGTTEGESRAYGVTEADEEDEQKAEPTQLTSAQAEASVERSQELEGGGWFTQVGEPVSKKLLKESEGFEEENLLSARKRDKVLEPELLEPGFVRKGNAEKGGDGEGEGKARAGQRVEEGGHVENKSKGGGKKMLGEDLDPLQVLKKWLKG